MTTVASSARQMKLSVFMMMDGNYHLAGWRLPNSHADAGHTIAHWVEFAKTLERGKLDILFIAGSNISPPGVDHPEFMSCHTARSWLGFEPLTLLSALSTVTTRLGLAGRPRRRGTEPYTLARMFASLDHRPVAALAGIW